MWNKDRKSWRHRLTLPLTSKPQTAGTCCLSLLLNKLYSYTLTIPHIQCYFVPASCCHFKRNITHSFDKSATLIWWLETGSGVWVVYCAASRGKYGKEGYQQSRKTTPHACLSPFPASSNLPPSSSACVTSLAAEQTLHLPVFLALLTCWSWRLIYAGILLTHFAETIHPRYIN